MGLHTEWIAYGTDEDYLGYLARPEFAETGLPAVIVIQEIWGVDDHIRDVTQRFAAAGYAAFAPDLYAKGGKRPDDLQPERIEEVKHFLHSLPPTAWGSMEARREALAKLPAGPRERIGQSFERLFGGLDPNNYMDQLVETVSFLRDHCEASRDQKVASIGFCIGGALSAQLACSDSRLQGAVIFYGTAPGPELLAGIQAPVLGFYGELDKRITDNVPAFAKQMKELGKQFDYQVYPNAHHAFFNDTRPSYQVDAARDAFARVISFLNRVLVAK